MLRLLELIAALAALALLKKAWDTGALAGCWAVLLLIVLAVVVHDLLVSVAEIAAG